MGYAFFPQVTPGVSPKVSIGGYNLGISAFSKHPIWPSKLSSA